MKLSVTVDVPDLAAGIAFYGGVFGLQEVARPLPTYAVLAAGEAQLCLMEKAPGTAPFAGGPGRDYGRHWTPVHLDAHVEAFEATLTAVTDLGGGIERQFPAAPGRPPVAFCADPFGNGFCVLGPRDAAP